MSVWVFLKLQIKRSWIKEITELFFPSSSLELPGKIWKKSCDERPKSHSCEERSPLHWPFMNCVCSHPFSEQHFTVFHCKVSKVLFKFFFATVSSYRRSRELPGKTSTWGDLPVFEIYTPNGVFCKGGRNWDKAVLLSQKTHLCAQHSVWGGVTLISHRTTQGRLHGKKRA